MALGGAALLAAWLWAGVSAVRLRRASGPSPGRKISLLEDTVVDSGDGHFVNTGTELQQTSDCVRHLKRCWQAEGKRWRGAQPDCKTKADLLMRARCKTVLCTSWFGKKCRLGSTFCLGVARMCAFQEPHGLDHARFDLGPKPTIEQRHRQKSFGWYRRNASAKEPLGMWSFHPTSMEVLDGKPLMFMHIPLNFGATVEEAGALHGLRWGAHQESDRMKMRDGYWCHNYLVPPYLLPMPNMYTDKEVFTIVRHPYARIVSEYKLIISAEWGNSWDTALLDKRPCTPESLNHWLQRALGRFLRGERYINDCHMLPQMEYIAGGSRRFAKWELGDVLHAEKLPGAFDELMASRNHSVRIASIPVVNAHKDVCPGISARDLTESSRAMINTIYYEDFQRLHYDMY
mmetsp:Transcript_76480/g.212426  ORF Transcript_76480/g.212426 Transcript_76480/m.212426 type:complete len:402 (+) Transcript_76480:136-1341(+)